MTPAYEYIRVSTGPQSKRMGPDVQHEGNQAYAARYDFNIVQTFTDVMTGSKDSRKDLDAMLLLAKEGKVKHVIVYNTSRIGRTARVSHNIAHEITQAGYTLHDYSTGKFDFKKVEDRTRYAALALANQVEYDNLIERFQESKVMLAASGKLPGFWLPYGYQAHYTPEGKRVLSIHEEQAQWVRQIFQWCIEGLGNYTITGKLIALKAPEGRMEGTWNKFKVRNMLKNRAYTGHAEFYMKRVSKSFTISVPAIVTEDIFFQAQQAIEKRRGRPPTLRAMPLTGVIRCGECGTKMQPVNYDLEKSYLRCDNKFQCDHRKTHRYTQVLAACQDLLEQALHDPSQYFRLESEKEPSNTGRLERELVALKEREKRVIDMAELGAIDLVEMKKRLEAIRHEESEKRLEVQRAMQPKQVKLSMNAWIRQVKSAMKNADQKVLFQAAGVTFRLYADRRLELEIKV